MGFGKGLAALGAGIAGFMLAIGGVGLILKLMGADGSALKTVIQNFFGAFSLETAAMMGGLIGIGALMSKFNVDKKQFMLGIFFLIYWKIFYLLQFHLQTISRHRLYLFFLCVKQLFHPFLMSHHLDEHKQLEFFSSTF